MSLARLCFFVALFGFLPACDDTSAAPASGPIRHEIEVDAEGYHPERVEARTGEPVTLVFTRTTDDGCGQDLVIAAHDIERDLPLNEPVEVTFTPESDEVVFACGMDMYRGTVVVR